MSFWHVRAYAIELGFELSLTPKFIFLSTLLYILGVEGTVTSSRLQ